MFASILLRILAILTEIVLWSSIQYLYCDARVIKNLGNVYSCVQEEYSFFSTIESLALTLFCFEGPESSSAQQSGSYIRLLGSSLFSVSLL